MPGTNPVPGLEIRNALSKNDATSGFDSVQIPFAEWSNVAVSRSNFWKSHPNPMIPNDCAGTAKDWQKIAKSSNASSCARGTCYREILFLFDETNRWKTRENAAIELLAAHLGVPDVLVESAIQHPTIIQQQECGPFPSLEVAGEHCGVDTPSGQLCLLRRGDVGTVSRLAGLERLGSC
jgi:hypothetical protein